MSAAAAAVLLPILAAMALGCFGSPLRGAYANLGVCAAVFGLTVWVFASPGAGLLQADRLGMIFGLLSGFVALTTSAGNIAFVRGELREMTPRGWRVYHAMCQLVLGATLMGLYADNIGLLWAALEIVTIAAALGISLPRTATALAAAWKYSILSGAGIALALFGSLVTYLAAQPALGPGLAAMSFHALTMHAAQLDGRLMTLAFIFLLFGYGTKAALVPLHGWLPDAYAEGPAPLTTMLSGLVLNVALIAILRFRALMQANFTAGGGAMQPGPFLLALGLASLLVAAFSLWGRADARRFLGVSSIEHSGIAAFAFGIGGAAAIFAALLQMLLHTLINSGLFQVLMQAAARGSTAPGNFGFGRLRGAAASSEPLAWMLGGWLFALTGLPLSGLFTSEFLIISQAIQRQPVLSLPLGLGLFACAAAVIRRAGPLLFNPPPQAIRTPFRFSVMTTSLHLLLVLILAFAMPPPLVRMLSGIASALQ